MSEENKEVIELSEGETLSTRTYSTDPSSISPIRDPDWNDGHTDPSDEELLRSRDFSDLEDYFGKKDAMVKKFKKVKVKKEEVASTDGTIEEKKAVKRKVVKQEDQVSIGNNCKKKF